MNHFFPVLLLLFMHVCTVYTYVGRYSVQSYIIWTGNGVCVLCFYVCVIVRTRVYAYLCEWICVLMCICVYVGTYVCVCMSVF
jgi:hypothetical protein